MSTTVKMQQDNMVRFRLPKPLLKRLDGLAKKKFTTRSEVARRAVVALVEEAATQKS